MPESGLWESQYDASATGRSKTQVPDMPDISQTYPEGQARSISCSLPQLRWCTRQHGPGRRGPFWMPRRWSGNEWE